MENKYQYIVIEGNIGAGKTSLTQAFCQKYNTLGLYEQFSDNPFLPLFYENPARFALQLELTFLLDRIRQQNNDLKNTLFHQGIVADYYLKKSMIFAAETLTDEEFKLYGRIYSELTGNMPQPDLCIFLHQTPQQLLKNIAKRGRTYESNISEEYLTKIQKSYFRFLKQIDNFPILIVDCTNIDFVSNTNLLQWLLNLPTQNWKNGYNILTPNESESV